jgi:tyrosine ammonia-lyase
MTGQAALNAVAARRLLDWAETLTVAVAELLRGRTEAWRPEFGQARPHPGQIESAARLRRLADGAPRLDAGAAAERVLGRDAHVGAQDRAPQDAYTLRCAPQVLGAARDAAHWHAEVAERELNSATDNPLFPQEGPPALHGGNFMGQHVGLASDALTNSVIVTANLAERQMARLSDERLNNGLPAFLHRGAPVLNSGFMGAQVTASALVAEMRARGGAASTQSISTNGANQDVVSMGTIAARGCADALADAARVQAILALAAAQGVDIVGPEQFGPATRALHGWVRARAPQMPGDRPLSGEIEALAEAMAQAGPPV